MGICFGTARPQRPLRVLILGIAACGKSTFLKQIEFINSEQSDKEMETFSNSEFTPIFLQNVVTGCQELIQVCMKEDLGMEEENMKHARFLININAVEVENTDTLFNKIKAVWQDKAIQKVWERKNILPLQMKNMDNLMQNLDKVRHPDFVPTREDVLMIRLRTTGVAKFNFVANKVLWEFIDVGGQKPEREKWKMVIEEGIDAVVYMAAIDEYSLLTKQDNRTNLEFSMAVFEETMKYEQLRSIPKLLFLNKMDLFDTSIQTEHGWTDFKKHFPDFHSDNLDEDTVRLATDHITSKFTKLLPADTFMDSVHAGCCLKIDYVTTIFETLKISVISKRLVGTGLVLE